MLDVRFDESLAGRKYHIKRRDYLDWLKKYMEASPDYSRNVRVCMALGAFGVAAGICTVMLWRKIFDASVTSVCAGMSLSLLFIGAAFVKYAITLRSVAAGFFNWRFWAAEPEVFVNDSGIRLSWYEERLKHHNAAYDHVWQVAYETIRAMERDTRKNALVLCGQVETIEYNGDRLVFLTEGQLGAYHKVELPLCFEGEEEVRAALNAHREIMLLEENPFVTV